MKIVTDASALTLLINPDASPPTDPTTGELVTSFKERIEFLIQRVDEAGGQVIVPTPALAEVLVKAEDAAPEIIGLLSRSSRFLVAEFDIRAAIEVASMTREAIRKGSKRDGVSPAAPWQKVKYDRQIVAVAIVHRATFIVSDDDHIRSFSEKNGLDVFCTWELPLPTKKIDLLNFHESQTSTSAFDPHM